MASQEAGCSSLHDFSDLDALEYRAWVNYSLEGASNARTQILLAQIIQMIGGVLGGKATPIHKLLPYYDEITGNNTQQAKKRYRQKHMAEHQGLIDHLISKNIKKQ